MLRLRKGHTVRNGHLDAHDVVNLLEGNDLSASVWPHLGIRGEMAMDHGCPECSEWVVQAVKARLRVVEFGKSC